jgi:DNA-binding NtrC family response regulator
VSEKKLLIVDDEPGIVLGMTRYFRSRGYHVDSAGGRAEAEALLTQVSYACVIADLCLTEGQGADGLEVIAQVAARQPRTPVVVLTAYGSPATEAAARRLGAVAFLSKPQPLEHLAEIVGGLLKGDPRDPGVTNAV